MSTLIQSVAEFGTLFSVVAFALLSYAESARDYKRAWFIQLLAQPFWMAATWNSRQYVMFVISIFFLLVAARGFMRHWALEQEDKMREVRS